MTPEDVPENIRELAGKLRREEGRALQVAYESYRTPRDTNGWFASLLQKRPGVVLVGYSGAVLFILFAAFRRLLISRREHWLEVEKPGTISALVGSPYRARPAQRLRYDGPPLALRRVALLALGVAALLPALLNPTARPMELNGPPFVMFFGFLAAAACLRTAQLVVLRCADRSRAELLAPSALLVLCAGGLVVQGQFLAGAALGGISLISARVLIAHEGALVAAAKTSGEGESGHSAAYDEGA